jgi:hypothetical protein
MRDIFVVKMTIAEPVRVREVEKLKVIVSTNVASYIAQHTLVYPRDKSRDGQPNEEPCPEGAIMVTILFKSGPETSPSLLTISALLKFQIRPTVQLD